MFDRGPEGGDDRAGDDGRAEIGDQPAHPARIGLADRLVDIAFARARKQQRVLPGLFGDDVGDIVGRDLADQPPVLIDHRGGDQCVFLEAQADFLLVEIDRDQRLVALHHVFELHRPRGAQDPAELAGPDRAQAVVDHEHFVEIARYIALPAQIIDQVANGQVPGHCHEFAAHQPPGGFLGIGERGFERRAVLGVELVENRALVGLVEVFEHRHRIVGVELFGDLRGRAGRQRLDQQFADVLIELGDDFCGHQLGDRGGE